MNTALIHTYQNKTILVFKVTNENHIRVEGDDVRSRLLSDEESVNITANLFGVDFLAGDPRAKRFVGKVQFRHHKGAVVDVSFKPSRRSHYGKSKFVLGDFCEDKGYHICVVMGSRPWVASLVHASSAQEALEFVTKGFPTQHIKTPSYNGMDQDGLVFQMCDHFNRCHLNNHNYPLVTKTLSSGLGHNQIFQVEARNQVQLDDWIAHINLGSEKSPVQICVFPGTSRCKVTVNTGSKFYKGIKNILEYFPPL